jgi:4-amino-4-deoxy-L-arabinose transferase-like glycosyltransferase
MPQIAALVAAGLCLAAGALTKWTAGLYVGALFVPLLVWQGHGRLVGARLLFAAFLALLPPALWFGAVVQRVGWEEMKRQLWIEAGPRLLAAERLEDRPSKSLLGETLQHPFKVLGCTLPLGPLALLTLAPAFWRTQDDGTRRLLRLLHCWVWPNLLIFTLLPNHASRHSLPFCAALSALAALFVASALEGRLPDAWRRWTRVVTPAGLAAFLLAWSAAKIALVELAAPKRDHERQTAAKAAALARLYPASETLFVRQAKDEGLMFYLDREVRRVRDWAFLPKDAVSLLLTGDEWAALAAAPPRPIRSSQFLKDAQGDTIVYVSLLPPPG